MTAINKTILLASLIAIAAIIIYHFGKNNRYRALIANLLLLSIIGFLMYNVFLSSDSLSLEAKGIENTHYGFVIALFACMTAGMFSQYLYNRFTVAKKERAEFDLGLFFAPVFASPIIFIPLYSAFQSADINIENITSAKFMIFLVAFQNGFFWKEFFDSQRKKITA
jgi:hypothetical protein